MGCGGSSQPEAVSRPTGAAEVAALLREGGPEWRWSPMMWLIVMRWRHRWQGLDPRYLKEVFMPGVLDDAVVTED